MTTRLRFALPLLFLAACTVPELKDVGQKKCDLDAGHACVEGYVCVAGVCQVPMGGSCTEGDSRACGTNVGECREGTQHCTGGMWGACEGSTGPTAELCDGKDNDCNTFVDDDIPTAPACEKTDGVCAGATQACVDGGFVATCDAASYGPDYEAIETTCDGKDNDCDGQTDESVTGGACVSVGVCDGNVRACTMGSPGVCQAPNFEAVETSCDNRDNDCDGMTDEDLFGPTLCAKQLGVCAGKSPACVGGAFEASCTQASYGVDFEPAETLCDGKDNDCDGATDRLADGGLIRLGMCELSAGVCSGARRACVGGNGEAPCTATSYGPDYEAVEATCDGLDNDCDGRPDISKEAALVLTPQASTNHLGLAASVNGGSAAIYVDQRRGASRVFFRRYDGLLRGLGNEIEVSDPAATDAVRPAITRVGQDFAVTWIETVGGVTRLKVARLSDSGTAAWTNTVASLVNVYNDPRIASAAATSSPIAVAWIEAPVLQLKGAVYDGAGNTVAPVTTLTTAPDAGGDLIFDVDVVRRTSSADFLIGWVAFASDFTLRFQAFNDALVPQGTPRDVTVPMETPRNVRVALYPPTGEVLGSWIGTIGNTQSTLRWMPNALTSPQPLVAATYAGSSTDLALAPAAAGTAAFWAQGLPQPRLVGLTLGGDAGVTDFTPAGVTGLFAPGVASLDGGVLHVGYEADRGVGLDLYGQVVCRP